MAAAISPPSSSLTQTDVSRLSSINFSGRTPQLFDIAGAIGLEIGGLTASQEDFTQVISDKLPLL